MEMGNKRYDYTAVVGDLHGSKIEMCEMIDLINLRFPNTQIILTSDFFDRGYDVLGCLALARENKLEAVLGNHDYRFLKWLKNRDINTSYYQSYYSEVSDDDIAYLRALPYYIELEDLIVVHAGIKPGLPMTRQDPHDMMYLRYTDNNRRSISLKKINKMGKTELNAKFWTEFLENGPPKNVIYGHHVHSTEEPFITKFKNGTMCVGIDTGVVFGGMLSALLVPRTITNNGHDWSRMEFLKVKAKQVYHQSDFVVR
jgi:hypothetical protein